SEQFDLAASRASELEQDIAHVRRVLGADINRVEACTLAALERQAQDRGAGEAMARRALDEQGAATRSAIEDMRQRVEEQMAALRGQQANAQARLDTVEAVLAVRSRVAELEERQTDAFHRLRNDISRFVADNERRLAQLEEAAPDLAAPFMAIEQRLAGLEQHDVGVVFAELRARIEERILGVEQRNVRTLEQLSDTVALIERRFSEDDERAARSA